MTRRIWKNAANGGHWIKNLNHTASIDAVRSEGLFVVCYRFFILISDLNFKFLCREGKSRLCGEKYLDKMVLKR